MGHSAQVVIYGTPRLSPAYHHKHTSYHDNTQHTMINPQQTMANTQHIITNTQCANTNTQHTMASTHHTIIYISYDLNPQHFNETTGISIVHRRKTRRSIVILNGTL
ncbi:hypothetical protein DPMN_013381 [Dreissena polymorpha]|uniref:Uncharacterized protein n=1 Tax=Dreissena polymorpha TaxID=45954 RepID=A0A9D4N467_DREPO|nr:hypothetical protein DPMN_013381 [Dreissena polymorpha]